MKQAPRGLWAQTHFWLFDVSQDHGIARRLELFIGWMIILSVVAIVA